MTLQIIAGIDRWKLKQNMILTLFMDGWFRLDEEDRAEQPYRFTLEKPINKILNPDGTVVCEFEFLEGNLNVIWLRGPEDLIALDEAGQALREVE